MALFSAAFRHSGGPKTTSSAGDITRSTGPDPVVEKRLDARSKLERL
jgi:hypothetical protein